MTRIVQLDDHEPLPIETKDGEVWICRCGLSKDWPYCDSSHKQARKEEPGKVYGYTRGDGELVGRVVEGVERVDPRASGSLP